MVSREGQENLSLSLLLFLSPWMPSWEGQEELDYICLVGMVWGEGDLVGKRTVSLQSPQLSMEEQFFP